MGVGALSFLLSSPMFTDVFRCLRLRRQMLTTMRPTAKLNAAAAATDSPAIWAGVMVLDGLVGAEAVLADGNEGAVARDEESVIESATSVWVGTELNDEARV